MKTKSSTAAPVYSRSMFTRNAKTKSGLMTNPKNYSKQRKENNPRSTKTYGNARHSDATTMTTIYASGSPMSIDMNTSGETRFTLPCNQKNVNIEVETARRQMQIHHQVMKCISPKATQDHTVELL